MKWSFELNGNAATPPHAAVRTLDRAAASAMSVVGADAVLFARVDPFDAASVAYAAAARGHVLVGREGIAHDVGAALEAALHALTLALPGTPGAIRELSQRPPVGDALLDQWRVPADARGFGNRLEALLDQRFLYHLRDEEALARAELEGRPFFIYGLRGRREHRLLVRTGSSWDVVEDIERPIWRLGSGAVKEVAIEARRVGAAPGTPRTFRLDQRHVVTEPTLDAALDTFAQRGTSVALAHVAELGRSLIFAKSDPEFVSIIGYEIDAYRVRAKTGAFGVPVWATPVPAPPPKASRLATILACPECRLDLPVAAGRRQQACVGCNRRFIATGEVLDFLHDGRDATAEDAHASRNSPAKQLVHELRLHPSGLILNAGAGDTPLRAENLVNLEIVRYPNTDVVADAQRLPFRDGVFDMVFSQSVIEHVPDPFAYSRELIRVLKPGGTLLADAPFVGPFHGYPDHYFNPTKNGLRVLCSGLEEIEVREGAHHDPSVALFSLLSSYVRLVRDPDARQRLLDLKVGEFLDQIRTGQNAAVLRDLDPAGTFEIASGFAFYGRKTPYGAAPQT